MKAEVVVSNRGQRLTELAVVLDAEYEAIEQAATLIYQGVTAGVMAAIRAGEALLEVRSLMPDQPAFEAWATENSKFRESTRRTYMRMGHYRSEIEAWIERGGTGTFVEAMGALRGLPSLSSRESDEQVRTEARRLHEDGLSFDAIGALFGFSKDTVRSWVDKKAKASALAASRKAKLQRRKARRALAREEHRRAATNAGGASGRFYTNLRKLHLDIDAALAEASVEERAFWLKIRSNADTMERVHGELLRLPEWAIRTRRYRLEDDDS